MSSRHLARSVVLQSLYEWDSRGRKDSLEEIMQRNLKEFARGRDADDNTEFTEELTRGVASKLTELNRLITKAAPAWPVDKIAAVDRNILRLSIYELLFSDPDVVPPKVAINEAVELAKTFGSAASARFVNGVLGTILRELEALRPSQGGDAKMQGTREDSSLPDVDYAGAVIFRKVDGKIYWLMVHDVFGYWTFVKGRRKTQESLEEAARREAKEEVGIEGAAVAHLGEVRFPAHDDKGEKILKRVVHFLLEAKNPEIKLEKNIGLLDAKWFLMEEVRSLKYYKNTEHIMEAALRELGGVEKTQQDK